jgi:hypothetical protein
MRILIISLLFGYLDAFLLRSPAIVQLGSKNGISLCKADQRSSNKNRIFMAAVSTANPANAFKGPLLKAFKKPSGALAVAVEYEPLNELSVIDLEWLSLELRKSKASAIFTESSIPILAAEQRKAKGNFPGPVPIISTAVSTSKSDVDSAKSAGAVGFILRPWQTSEPGLTAISELASYAASQMMETLWEVGTAGQAKSAVASGATILLLTPEAADTAAADSSVASTWRDSAGGAAIVAPLRAMQAGNSEVNASAALRAAGAATAVVLSGSCVGDGEDAEYARWAVEALSSKASREFRITGMTGHVNGHYGTGTFERATGERQWRRTGGSTGWAPASTNSAGRKSAAPP